jgi:hypothetical protein
MFALFAWLQRNDLDPAIYDRPSVVDAALWFAFYLLIAALFVWSLFLRVPKWLLAAAALACLVELATTAPGLWENLFGARDFTLTFFSHTFSRSLLLLSEVAAGADVLAAGGVEAGAVLTASCAMASGPHNNSSAGMVFMNRMQKPPKGRAAYPRTSG